MLRREARLRREYLYRKAREEAQRSAHERKEKVRRALEENRLIPTELRREALALQESLEFDDAGGEGVTNHVDDEYRWAGVEDPKVMITTSRDPSSRLKMFAKELKLVFPGAQRMNRGRHEVGALVRACKANGVTDLLVVHEHRGTPGKWDSLSATCPSAPLLISHCVMWLCGMTFRTWAPCQKPNLTSSCMASPPVWASGSLTYFVTCSLCPKMTATGSSPSPTRMTTFPSGTMCTGRPTTAMSN
ncbi:U3 small nucleolar ribonucleoprotein IMP4 isoform X3 [Pteropus medius]|uniref:U3 small nucleolar ribonucleoprotein protein IMP4 isoform X4 n=1 Tax=Pteropus vampyrus TaxID=132908 RepID=A0A6P3QTY7_PTEVA|nr:U3 small nucleolar ribonucleoprotein protein IMP4 isoform X4 [Pteropus vampyrus]XP_011366053.1 U3 small nucleolar ribonucleoprotein protein IMP4 isoform X4 [Pteropus vampyrus]XP_039725209.1 U3 small nucleolar ribonucleoprotein protein IMP4 isoform X3 [Pteropus giganteus]XP_039725210.1 U3 small nucleolar ribonucleoprotein protein IMP4 isoform X3 [Pteropus giganteus]